MSKKSGDVGPVEGGIGILIHMCLAAVLMTLEAVFIGAVLSTAFKILATVGAPVVSVGFIASLTLAHRLYSVLSADDQSGTALGDNLLSRVLVGVTGFLAALLLKVTLGLF